VNASGITRRTFLRTTAASALLPFGSGCALARPKPRNVVLVLVDELRKDTADQALPRLNRLAARGVVFEQMRSAAPWTYPSVVTLFSGLYPQQHGAEGHVKHWDLLSTFSNAVPLLHKVLRTAGYVTAAFVTNPFLHRWNPFHEGFETYDISFIGFQGNRRNSSDRVWIPERMFAATVNQSIREHFDARPPRAPEFTYVHYIDVHGPWHEAPFLPDYESAVRFVDERVSELYEYFVQRYDGDLIFLVTSDHGRGLPRNPKDADRGYGLPWRRNKASVHDFNLRIPCLVLPGAGVPEARTVSEPCSNVDIAPTLYDWLGLSPGYACAGASLLPAMRGQRIPDENRPLYARHAAFLRKSDGLVYQDKKYVRFFDIETDQVVMRRVFDLGGDPEETRSLGGDFGEAGPLLAEAAGMHGLSYPTRFDEDAVDPEARRAMEALGYFK